MTLLAVWPRSPRLPSQNKPCMFQCLQFPTKACSDMHCMDGRFASSRQRSCDSCAPQRSYVCTTCVTALILHSSLAAPSIASLVAPFAKQIRWAVVTAVDYVQASIPVRPAHFSTYWQIPSHLDTAIPNHATVDSVMYGQCPPLRVPCATPCTIIYTLVVSALTPFPTLL